MVVEDGYEFYNDRTLVTVFSAPNYCGEFDVSRRVSAIGSGRHELTCLAQNFAAVMSVSEDLLCSFELLKVGLEKAAKDPSKTELLFRSLWTAQL